MKANPILLVIIGLSLGLSGYSAWLGTRELEASDSLGIAWNLVFAFLIAFWAHADTADRGLHRPLDFGYFLTVFWPVALPYYLARTRGIEGLVQFAGFVLLASGPFIAGLVAWTYAA